jgi:hypothetical protein
VPLWLRPGIRDRLGNNMRLRNATIIFISVVAVMIAAWDVYVITYGGIESSISQTMIEWAYHYPIFPFIIGVIVGHLFWRLRGNEALNKITDATKN